MKQAFKGKWTLEFVTSVAKHLNIEVSVILDLDDFELDATNQVVLYHVLPVGTYELKCLPHQVSVRALLSAGYTVWREGYGEALTPTEAALVQAYANSRNLNRLVLEKYGVQDLIKKQILRTHCVPYVPTLAFVHVSALLPHMADQLDPTLSTEVTGIVGQWLKVLDVDGGLIRHAFVVQHKSASADNRYQIQLAYPALNAMVLSARRLHQTEQERLREVVPTADTYYVDELRDVIIENDTCTFV